MKNLELTNQVNSIKALFKKAEVFVDDSELLGNWAKFLCIIASGFIENALKILFTDYITKTSNLKTARFASFYINDKQFCIKNPDSEGIAKLLQKFDDEWKTRFESYLEDNLLYISINSIKGNRNQIAHGGYRLSSLSLVGMKEYFLGAIKVVEYIESMLNSTDS